MDKRTIRQQLRPKIIPKPTQKVLAYFHNSLPTNFILSQKVLFGQCLIAQSAPTISRLSKRKRCRYITNNIQIIFMFLEDGSNQRLTKHKYLRIGYDQIQTIKLSVYYCGILLVYSFYAGKKQREKFMVYVEAVDVMEAKGNQLRQFIIKMTGLLGGVQGKKLENYCQETLLDYQLDEDQDADDIVVGTQSTSRKGSIDIYEQNQQEDKMVSRTKIRRTKIVNLKKKKEEALKWASGEESKNKKVDKFSKDNFNNKYRIYAQMPLSFDKKQKPVSHLYLAQKTPFNQKTPNLCSLKLTPLQNLSKSPSLLSQTLSQCQIHKSYQLMTPYVPCLNRVVIYSNYLVMEYTYFEVHTIRQLLKKDKIGSNFLDKHDNGMRDFVAQIVCAVGHRHQCGVVGGIGCDSVGVAGDGLVIFIGGGVICSDQLGQEGQMKKMGQLEQTQTFELDISRMSPQQYANPQHRPSRSSDWWQVGLIIFQLIAKYPYFNASQTQKIKQELLDLKKEMSLQKIQKMRQKNAELYEVVRSLLQKQVDLRLGHKNDYHTVLDMPFFKGIDKNKLMRRQGQPLFRIHRKKIGKELPREMIFGGLPERSSQLQMKQIDKGLEGLLKQVLFDRDLQIL